MRLIFIDFRARLAIVVRRSFDLPQRVLNYIAALSFAFALRITHEFRDSNFVNFSHVHTHLIH